MKSKVEKCANKGIKQARKFMGYLNKKDLTEDEIDLVLKLISIWVDNFRSFSNVYFKR